MNADESIVARRVRRDAEVAAYTGRVPGGTSVLSAHADGVWRPLARTLGDLLTDPRVTAPARWVLPPFVEAGEVALLSAPPKMGKSHLASQLAATLSSGGQAIDGSPLRAAPVLWLGVDESVRRLVPRLAALGADRARFHVVERDPEHLLTAEHLAWLLEKYEPTLVVLDTTSQLALDTGIDPNDGAAVGGFLRPLVDAVRAASTPETPCAGLFIHHAPNHAARAAGSFQWRAVVDADVVLRRPRRNVDPNAAEPDEDADVPTGDDGARVLEGVTRAFGPFKLRLGFVAGRYALADAAVPLIDRVRTLLTTMETGPGLSSASKLRGRLSCNNSLLLDVLARLEARGEVLTVGVGRSPQRHYVPTASARLYVSGARFGTSAEEVAPPCEGAAEEARGERGKMLPRSPAQHLPECIPPPMHSGRSSGMRTRHPTGPRVEKSLASLRVPGHEHAGRVRRTACPPRVGPPAARRVRPVRVGGRHRRRARPACGGSGTLPLGFVGAPPARRRGRARPAWPGRPRIARRHARGPRAPCDGRMACSATGSADGLRLG